MNSPKKRLFIIGPVPDKEGKKIGGVAEFNFSLAESMSQYFETFILTDTINPLDSERITTISVGSGKKYSILTLLKMHFILRKMHPSIIISGLQYSLTALFIKSIKIHFLHGFLSPQFYSNIKIVAMKFINIFITKSFDYQIANSNFTKVINELFYKTQVDYAIPIGVNNDFISETETKEGKNIDILFVGRFVKAKGIYFLMEALKRFDKSVVVYLVGDGPEMYKVKQIAASIKCQVIFTGSQPRKKVIEYYKKSKVFVSLNSHEPFGITFLEAALCGCNIVCPNTGGQVEFLSQLNDNVKFISDLSPQSLGVSLDEMMHTQLINYRKIEKMKRVYSYDRVANEIISKCGLK